MKKAFMSGLVILIILFVVTGCAGSNVSGMTQSGESLENAEPQNEPGSSDMPPQLDLLLFNTGLADYTAQSEYAIQLSTSWMYIDENGVGRGIEADAPHPLQLSPDAYDSASIRLYEAVCDCIDGKEHIAVKLEFSDGSLPDSISATRWDSSLAKGNQDIDDLIGMGEPVEIDGDIIHIKLDGNSYFYSLWVIWPNGNVNYAFRTESNPEEENDVDGDQDYVLDAPTEYEQLLTNNMQNLLYLSDIPMDGVIVDFNLVDDVFSVEIIILVMEYEGYSISDGQKETLTGLIMDLIPELEEENITISHDRFS